MKVYHITEAPRIEPTVGSLGDRPTNRGPSVSGGSNSPRLTSVDITDTGILDRNGNKIFKVVDQDGKELFRGNEAQANDKRDTLRRTIRPIAPAGATSNADRSVGPAGQRAGAPDVDAPAPNTTAGNSRLRNVGRAAGRVGKAALGVLSNSFFGMLIGAGFLTQEIYEQVELYAEALDANGMDQSHDDVVSAKKIIVNTMSNAVVQLFVGAASGVASVAIITRIFGIVPGLGWVVALIGGGIGSIAAFVLTKSAKNEALVGAITDWIVKRLDDQLLANIANLVPEDQEVANTSIDNAVKDAMKDMIRSDPKMIQAFKKAKELKAKATAS